MVFTVLARHLFGFVFNRVVSHVVLMFGEGTTLLIIKVFMYCVIDLELTRFD